MVPEKRVSSIDLAKQHLLKAKQLRETGSDGVESELLKAHGYDPKNARTLKNLGVVLAELGRLDDAISRFEAALKIDPGYVKALTSLGAVLGEQGKLAEARSKFEKALIIDPKNVIASKLLRKTQNLEAKSKEVPVIERGG